MKFDISREIKSGKFIVSVIVKEITEDEKAKIRKFGPPMVSILPELVWVGAGFESNISLHTFNNSFEFDTEAKADVFYNNIVERIKIAVKSLKEQQDKFSLSKEYEF